MRYTNVAFSLGNKLCKLGMRTNGPAVLFASDSTGGRRPSPWLSDQHKDDQEMNDKYRAGVYHFQIISLENTKLSFAFFKGLSSKTCSTIFFRKI